jgi:hypothetical protein
LSDSAGVRDVARVERERPGQIHAPGAREHVRLDERRHGEPPRPVLQLEATQLDALVCLRMGPERYAEVPRPLGHPQDVSLDGIQVEEQRGRFQLVHRVARH